ncbi:endonuclease/exonuclease/phosphatase family protein [Pseudonocardia endophytica]|uniref:Vancomycin resistance protein VanJ n=1 Tax=Pseudonocardia endophytica TaxID=401976 RepID=A0A4R1HK49_PSEEN|nr:endonuclease/exonuclease/phosphatase family protein [Pseudonocardia endophytica]TCK20885.1 vancomycin resistance protein VanJ [Pseudonocardia endophytica]
MTTTDVRPARRAGLWRRGLVLAALALLSGLVMALHARIPNACTSDAGTPISPCHDRLGNVGSLVETVLPWFGLVIPVVLVGALVRRSASALVALLLPITVWLSLFGGLLGDRSHPGGDLTVASHNVSADNPDPAGTARALAASGADVLALEEIDPQVRGVYERELATAYPFHVAQGTVGLWSRLPLSDVRPVDVAMDSTRALRATVATERGPLAVYVAHLGSVRIFPINGFWTADRDAGAQALAAAVRAEPVERVVVLGDLNGTLDDRALDDLSSQTTSVQVAAGDGLGFTWPTPFPVARIDQILVRGVQPDAAWSLPATGSDHLPVAARISW